VFAAASFACGDDDDSSKGDAGVSGKGGGGGSAVGGKSGTSGSGGAATGPAMIPRPDGGISANDPVPPCTRGSTTTCKAGQICDLVIRRAAGDMQYTAYTGCVDPGRERGAGDICDLDLTKTPLYTTPGLIDEVHRDLCGPGLACAPDRSVRGLGRCQTECSSGALDPTEIPCASADEVCLQATQVSEYCRKQDGCDPVKQTGCLPNSGEICFLTPSDDWRRIVSICQPPYDMPTADGAQCGRFTCNEGSACLGPSSQTPEQWQQADIKCRRVCGGTGTGAGAAATDQVEADAGAPLGVCIGKSTCEPFTSPSTVLSSIPTPPRGLCEP
jgi:hypothetical protein